MVLHKRKGCSKEITPGRRGIRIERGWWTTCHPVNSYHGKVGRLVIHVGLRLGQLFTHLPDNSSSPPLPRKGGGVRMCADFTVVVSE